MGEENPEVVSINFVRQKLWINRCSKGSYFSFVEDMRIQKNLMTDKNG